MQNKLREAWYIGLFDSLPLLRDPMLLVVVSLFSFLPVFFIFVFAGGDTALPALVGAIVLSLAFVGLFIAQSVYFNKHWFRFQDMLVASPVSPVSYAAALLPPLLQPFALLVPTAQAAQLSKYYFGLLSLSGFEIAFGWAYLIAFAVIMGLITIKKAHWVDP